MEGFRLLTLNDDAWGEIKICYPTPKPGNIWGALKPLQDTHWGKIIAQVTGESLSEALHGFATPFMREVGRAPKDCGKRLSQDDATCRLKTSRGCSIAHKGCTVAPLTELPFCYEAPNLERPSFDLASFVAQMWNENRYVVVLTSPGFSL